MKRTTTAGLILMVMAGSFDVAKSAVINVPADQPTIQAGIDAARSHDTVLVAPGVYLENVLIHGKPVYLSSHFSISGDHDDITSTIIDGSSPVSPDSASVIRLLYTIGAVVRGFTITGGTGTTWRDRSDGLLYREGGGILTEAGNPRILDNVIIGNEAIDLSRGEQSAGGGGIRCGYGDAQILHNVIAFNKGLYGGGIVAFHNPVTIRNNVIYRNSGGEHFGGGGVWITATTGAIQLENNTILENRSVTYGGGVLLWANVGNLVNNILWANEAPRGAQIRTRGAPDPSVQYCNVQGGWTGTGNISLDPALELQALVLQAASPCVDMGDPEAAYHDPEESGQPGVARFPARGTTHNDQGAYGGPGASAFPAFAAPGFDLLDPSIDLGTVGVGVPKLAWIRVTKSAFGLVRVDSVSFTGAHAADFALSSGLPISLGPTADDALDSLAVIWTPTTYGPARDTAWIHHDDPGILNPLALELTGETPGATGDPNQDGIMNSADVIYLVNFVFKTGPEPKPVPRSGDVNCDASVTSSDIIYMVNFVFKSGPVPCV